MPYPTPSDYQEAVQFPETAFTDPELAAGEVATNALGLPQPITGAFAAVFRVDTPSGRYAVRCFLADSEDRRARYKAISRRLADAELPALVPFEFQPEGVRVGERALPLLKMAWAEGEGLDAFVERHREDEETLRALMAHWRTLLRDLNEAGIAHGDLQHGNVLVHETEDGPELRLVDYDAMYVPALKGRSSAEVGHRNYQHPDRTETAFDPTLDHFPGLVVYTALAALAERPGLWDNFATGENLLFQSADFYDPKTSALFEELRQIETVRPLAAALETACYLRPEAVPSLEEVLQGDVPENVRVRRRRPAHEERRPERSLLATWVLPSLALLAVLAVGVGWWAGPAVGLGLAAAALLVLAGLAMQDYRSLSLVRRRQRLGREAAVLERWVADLEDERQSLMNERTDFVRHIERFRAERLQELQNEALEHRLKHHFVNEVGELEGVGHRGVVRLKVAGVRTAFHAAPERVAQTKGLTTAQRRHIDAWRAGLAERYEHDVPDALSPAEEQRLRRQVQRRLADLEAQIARLQAKQALQEAELEKVRMQTVALPELTLGRYLRYLARLASLPQARAPLTPVETTPVPVPEPDDDRAWWSERTNGKTDPKP